MNAPTCGVFGDLLVDVSPYSCQHEDETIEEDEEEG